MQLLQEVVPPEARPPARASLSARLSLALTVFGSANSKKADGWMEVSLADEREQEEEEAEQADAATKVGGSEKQLQRATATQSAAEKGEAVPPPPGAPGAPLQQLSFGRTHNVLVSEATFKKGEPARLLRPCPSPFGRHIACAGFPLRPRSCSNCALLLLMAAALPHHAAQNPGMVHHMLLYHVFFAVAILATVPAIIITACGGNQLLQAAQLLLH
jgi:hypothetical protein